MVSGLELQVNFPETQSISDGAGKTLKHRGLHHLSGVPTLKGWLNLMIPGGISSALGYYRFAAELIF